VRVLYTKSFGRDIDTIKKNATLKKRILEIIERLKEVESLDDVKGIKKIEGYEAYYRLRIGDYRLGIKLVGDTLELIRFLTGRTFTGDFHESRGNPRRPWPFASRSSLFTACKLFTLHRLREVRA